MTHETNLAARVAFERANRDWTYDALARHMQREGCPIGASALQKIEKGNPPRRINVDEHQALARVFGIDAQELLQHPIVLYDSALSAAVSEYIAATQEVMPFAKRWQIASARVAELAAQDPAGVAAGPMLQDAQKVSYFASLFDQLQDEFQAFIEDADG